MPRRNISKNPTPAGLEPAISGLEVQRLSPIWPWGYEAMRLCYKYVVARSIRVPTHHATYRVSDVVATSLISHLVSTIRHRCHGSVWKHKRFFHSSYNFDPSSPVHENTSFTAIAIFYNDQMRNASISANEDWHLVIIILLLSSIVSRHPYHA